MQIVVTCRAVIIHGNTLLMCRQTRHNNKFYNLPGGKLEPGETIDECIKREIYEETGIRPKVGKILFINQFISDKNHLIEFFYRIENPKDFLEFNPKIASHAFEVADFVMDNPTNPAFDIKPTFLADRFDQLTRLGDKFATEVVISH
jgi:ADP-ribose pyrophosphatase YjhB (NUDIX family)